MSVTSRPWPCRRREFKMRVRRVRRGPYCADRVPRNGALTKRTHLRHDLLVASACVQESRR
jgi:hypothetical protein